jgi:acetyl-CoA/propionyl-CoA carboxylase biotin carboxyl carrier protein
VATVLPFHRAAVESSDFIGTDGFKVHTRWIETDFAAMPDAMQRPAPASDPLMTRTWLEIDGKRISIGLPNMLLASLGAGGRAGMVVPERSEPAQQGHVLAPVSGALQTLKVSDGETVAEGDLLAIMEVMKMETQIQAPKAGNARLLVKEGEIFRLARLSFTLSRDERAKVS